MTEYLTPKLPTETVAYMADWSRQLGEDTIASYTLTVSSGTVTLSGQEMFPQFVRFLVSGGANGETATLAHAIVTSEGQALSRILTLKVATGVTAITPSTTTKRQIINLMFTKIGLADYEFNTTNEEKASALTQLDAMMAQWRGPGFGIDLGYNFPASIGQSGPADEAGIPDSTFADVAAQLALRVAPNIGKTLSPESRWDAAQALVTLRAQYASIPERTPSLGTARGSGSKPWGTWNPFVGSGG